MTGDMELVRDYALHDSEKAFAELVSRHLNMVYAVARRATGNAAHAEEIAQAVFIILAAKSRGLGQRASLSGWLFQTTRLTAANFVRAEIRRTRREQEAFMQSNLPDAPDDPWRQIAPLLDAALASLGERDRSAIMLRFFEGRNLAEVGALLGASENAAKKRVNRALDKLRGYFEKRGVVLSPAVLGPAMLAHAAPAAPASLAATVTATALKGSASAASTATLIKGTLKLMAWTKAKITATAVAAVLLAGATATVTVKQIQEHRTYPWQEPGLTAQAIFKLPPAVVIVPTKFPNDMLLLNRTRQITAADGRRWGLGYDLTGIILGVYGGAPARTVFQSALPQQRYDYIANLTSGSKEALQEEIKRKFGVAARFETIQTNVLLLQVRDPNAAGLKPTSAPSTPGPFISMRYEITSTNQPISSLAARLEEVTGIPILDKTGLAGGYDFDLKWGQYITSDQPYAAPGEQLESLKKALVEQLGLELVPDKAPVEMLVVEKAK